MESLPDSELMWFKSYLAARKQQCLVNGCLSSQSDLGPDYMNRAGPVSRAGLSLPGSQHVC